MSAEATEWRVRMSEERSKDDDLEDLLTAVRAEEKAAFSKLLERYRPLLQKKIARYAGKAGEDEKADTEQEAIFALHRAAMRYRPMKEVTFGLYAEICIDNALKSRYRQEKRRRQAAEKAGIPIIVSLDEEEENIYESFQDTVVEQENVKALLARIKKELSTYEQKVFELYMQGLSVEEMANRLGRTEKSVRNAITRLLSKLRQKLG